MTREETIAKDVQRVEVLYEMLHDAILDHAEGSYSRYLVVDADHSKTAVQRQIIVLRAALLRLCVACTNVLRMLTTEAKKAKEVKNETNRR